MKSMLVSRSLIVSFILGLSSIALGNQCPDISGHYTYISPDKTFAIIKAATNKIKGDYREYSMDEGETWVLADGKETKIHSESGFDYKIVATCPELNTLLAHIERSDGMVQVMKLVLLDINTLEETMQTNKEKPEILIYKK